MKITWVLGALKQDSHPFLSLRSLFKRATKFCISLFLMQKIIVTSSGFTGYSTIFNVEGDTIDLHIMEETDLDTYTDLCLAHMPFDIKFEIFERVIFSMIKAGLIKKAMATLLTSSSQICKLFYCKYIGNYDLDRTQILDHLISLFNLIEDITHVMYHPQVETREELVLSIFCRNSLSIDIVNKQWPLGHISQTIIEIHNTVDQVPDIKRIRTGPSYSDIVWVSGLEEGGILYTSLFKGPILVLEVYDLHRTITTQRTSFFSNVVRMLKVCLGSRSGVYLVQPYDEGFFGLVQEVV